MRYQINLRARKEEVNFSHESVYPFFRFRPIYLFTGRGVKEEDIYLHMEAMNEVLSVAKVDGIIPIKFYRNRHSNKLYDIIEQYIEQSFNSQRNQYDASKILDLFLRDPWQRDIPHYSVLLLQEEDLYTSREPNLRFLIGASAPDVGSVLSLRRYKSAEKEVKKQAGIHEYGHAFLMLYECENRCSMRFPNVIPLDLIYHTKDRLEGKAFCSSCERDGYNSFWKRSPFLDYFRDLCDIYDKLKSRDPETLEKVKTGELAKIEIFIKYF